MKTELVKVVATIRKLLRTAQDPKATQYESAVARACADSLMEKHRLHVSLEDYTEAVPGVLGHNWRERLLFVAAKHEHCRVRAGREAAVVCGALPEQVADAVRLYERLEPMALTAAYVAMREHYTSYAPRNLASWDEWRDYDDESSGPPPLELYAPVFFRVFINTAIDHVTETLVGPVKEPQYMAPPPSVMRAEKRRDASAAKEREAVADYAKKLADAIGVYETQEMLRIAAEQGERFAGRVQLDPPRLMLMAKSASFAPPPPPPPPSRWSYLELD